MIFVFKDVPLLTLSSCQSFGCQNPPRKSNPTPIAPPPGTPCVWWPWSSPRSLFSSVYTPGNTSSSTAIQSPLHQLQSKFLHPPFAHFSLFVPFSTHILSESLTPDFFPRKLYEFTEFGRVDTKLELMSNILLSESPSCSQPSYGTNILPHTIGRSTHIPKHYFK